jgi:molybdopterin/thiamine biosynthesis adenylyltransferase
MALVGAAAVGRPKVEALGRALVRRFPDLAVTTLRAEFPTAEAVRLVAPAEVLVTTTDADAPRLAAGRLARSLLQIHVDIGTSTDRWSRTSGADVRVCLPSDRCLLCMGGVASRDLYREPRRPGTSSRLINAAATHVAIELLAAILAGGQDRSRWVRLECGWAGGILASREAAPDATCPWCGVQDS